MIHGNEMKSLLEAIAERPLLSDGAMGTQLQAAGLELGAVDGLPQSGGQRCMHGGAPINKP